MAKRRLSADVGSSYGVCQFNQSVVSLFMFRTIPYEPSVIKAPQVMLRDPVSYRVHQARSTLPPVLVASHPALPEQPLDTHHTDTVLLALDRRAAVRLHSMRQLTWQCICRPTDPECASQLVWGIMTASEPRDLLDVPGDGGLAVSSM